MSWIPAPEAHVETGDQLALDVGAVDEFGLGSAQARCVTRTDVSVLAPYFEHIDGANNGGLLNQDLDFAGSRLPGPDAIRPSALLDVVLGDSGVLGGRATRAEQGNEEGQGGKGRNAAHVLGSGDGWVRSYLDIPFAPKGRTRAGLDCWGLIRLVYAEQLGIALPAWSEGYAETAPNPDTAAHLAACASAFAEIPVLRAIPGDILLFRTGRHLSHVGLALAGGRMLHIMAGLDCCIEGYLSPRWKPRLVGAYRPEAAHG